MTALYWIGAIVTIAVLLYLLAALLEPERFS